MKTHRAVFLDLNGTLVLPLKQESLDEMTLVPGADTAIARLLTFGLVCPVVTVQARIEKGLFTEAEFRAWFMSFFSNLGLDVKGPYICPHKYNHVCPCQKPNSLLYQQAAQELGLDLSRSYTIGDSPQDVQAACRFGGTGCLVRTGWAAQDQVVEKARASAAFIGDTIADAVQWILSKERDNREQRNSADRLSPAADC
ncbi:MAG: hypothetical protein CL477_02870 [Acidobacteria bacterium]|jgi:D-glycero-D-manno-heptose 1,7-bisphosphate phosphatase|nr:hypothetical protein [Acidobacteriota bacterium]MDP7338015.1 HAD-IIIA family hydrolase [Vicinamibacterales bacterium]|tara:strand:- start:148 stop:741 length:594 start_codon:yes stop_codon:yes gene_type:complete